MPSVRLLSLAVLGMGTFSACSAGEIARLARDYGHEVSAPIATLDIPPAPGVTPPPPPAPAPALASAGPPATSALVEVEPSAAPAPESEPAPTADGPSDDEEADEPSPNSQRELEPLVDPGHLLVAIGRETLIYERPSLRSQKIGYLRAGAQVRRAEKPAGFEGCKLGFYHVMPEGYVCVGATATLDPNHPVAQFSRVRPDRSAAMPYLYGRSLYPTPPFYTRLPSKLEQQQQEVELARHLQYNTRFPWRNAPSDPTPPFLLSGGQAPTPFGYAHEPNKLTSGRAVPDSSFALLAIYDHQGRRFGLTTDMSLLPLDRMKPVVPSTFHGLPLSPSVTLPVVFVRGKSAFLYSGSPKAGLSILRPLGFREAVPITGRSRTLSGLSYLETTSGEWLRDENLVRVDKMVQRPGWVKPGRTWIHVSILKQSMVAYEGDTPVYVTLVSTGADGLGDPKTTHSTVRGQFLIHTKHVTATMDSDEVGDEFDLRDVPYVQYFSEGFAFHAAYWHDTFGTPHSHGCVNISPIDSRWLFHWTDPPVPQAWHGAMTLRGGTLVYISP
ncbi:MAG TPA: L,D-transpeptidase [Polyangiaceae bacterium]|nr:L,D-transpeptidase [Polyangiaceae bacterium]